MFKKFLFLIALIGMTSSASAATGNVLILTNAFDQFTINGLSTLTKLDINTVGLLEQLQKSGLHINGIALLTDFRSLLVTIDNSNDFGLAELPGLATVGK